MSIDDTDLFLLIFRNQYLWKIISFYLKSRNCVSLRANRIQWKSYQEYQSVDKMLISNHIQLLIDKIKYHPTELQFKPNINVKKLFRLQAKLIHRKKQLLSPPPLDLSCSSFYMCQIDGDNDGESYGNVQNIEEEETKESLEKQREIELNEIKEKEDHIMFCFLYIFYRFQETIESSCFIIDLAVESRCLDIVKMLHYTDIKMNKTINGVKYATNLAMDLSSRFGDMDILQFLHQNRKEGASTNAMDLAASHGHLEVIEFLHNNRSEGATISAIETSAINNHLSVVEFLCKNRKDGFRPFIIAQCQSKGLVKIVEVLKHYDQSQKSQQSPMSNMFSSLISNLYQSGSNSNSSLLSFSPDNSFCSTFEDLKKTKKKSNWISWNWS
ncbi:hypothetical protein DLAC_01108 [Tieghemostelium lacteum]|uniref:Ankyrin repeat-containing protein n=1 Tax=Tieghemostelium lacteum TaxID=361077 RepID=A0A152A7T2_TIELA|nr:hypothetical protein DLAC_01108 [Tieghemostelium lacteum]|eukprot:KYR02276.1 hypothetical protein DLAC_01108 [Tieghemostelium lacteum]